jgi:hypothetical protein
MSSAQQATSQRACGRFFSTEERLSSCIVVDIGTSPLRG